MEINKEELEKYSFKTSKLFNTIDAMLPRLGTIGLNTPMSLGIDSSKKSSGNKGLLINISSLKFTNKSDKPFILWKFNSITLELKVGKNSLSM